MHVNLIIGFSSCSDFITDFHLLCFFLGSTLLFQRDDMEVLDEPLYANFLQVTGVDRPYREEFLSKMVRLCALSMTEL